MQYALVKKVIVRALGGSTKKLPPELAEKHDNPYIHEAHTASAIPETDYEKIVGSKPFFVNSIHSFIVDNQRSQFTIFAYDDDGNIEVVGNKDLQNHFVIASRFHPEAIFRSIDNAKDEEEVKKIINSNQPSFRTIEEFIKACNKNRDIKNSIDINKSIFNKIIYPDL